MDRDFREYDGHLLISEAEIATYSFGILEDVRRSCTAVLKAAANTQFRHGGPGPDEVLHAVTTSDRIIRSQRERFPALMG